MYINQQSEKWTKKSGILIIGISLIGAILNYIVQYYRGSWIYQYGSLISHILFYGGVFCSIVNTIFLVSKHKTELKNNLIWIILSAIPFLYAATKMLIVFRTDI